MHPIVLHAHLAIHNGIVGSITGCLLIGISRNVAADFVYYFYYCPVKLLQRK